MEQIPSSEPINHSANQEILHFLWNTKVHYHVKKSPPIPKSYVTFHNKLAFYGEELLALHPVPKLEDYTFSVVRNCLVGKFAPTLHV
jgi:hypothetical protein